MKGIKYVNLIKIGPVVIEIRGVEKGDIVVPVSNTLTYRLSFLATDILLVNSHASGSCRPQMVTA